MTGLSLESKKMSAYLLAAIFKSFHKSGSKLSLVLSYLCSYSSPGQVHKKRPGGGARFADAAKFIDLIKRKVNYKYNVRTCSDSCTDVVPPGPRLLEQF